MVKKIQTELNKFANKFNIRRVYAVAASVCEYDERKSVCSFFALLYLTTYSSCSCCRLFHLVCKIVFFCFAAEPVSKMVANESWKIHYLLFPGSPSCSSLFAPLCIHMSKHFAVSCSSFSAAYLNQFKLSLQQQRQQLGKAHVAPTAVTLCLPLPVAICQLAIIKDCPAANAVLFPPSLLPSPSPSHPMQF